MKLFRKSKSAWSVSDAQARPLAENPTFAPGCPVTVPGTGAIGGVIETRLTDDGDEVVLAEFAEADLAAVGLRGPRGYFPAASLTADIWREPGGGR